MVETQKNQLIPVLTKKPEGPAGLKSVPSFNNFLMILEDEHLGPACIVCSWMFLQRKSLSDRFPRSGGADVVVFRPSAPARHMSTLMLGLKDKLKHPSLV